MFCRLQAALKDLNYYEGIVDGVFGEKTEQAVRNYKTIENKFIKEELTLRFLEYLEKTVQEKEILGFFNDSIPERPKTQIIKNHLGGIAPLTIKTAIGNDFNIYIKNIYEKKINYQIYIRGGEQIKFKVPLGSYIIQYASGQKWFNNNCVFGKSTSFSETSEIFEFTKKGRDIYGWTVELFIQQDGNLRSEPINPDEFFN